MSIIENFRTALSSIISNKMRSLLTMLGIIIGITAVITITTLGNTLSGTVMNTLLNFGANSFSIEVMPKNQEEDDFDYDISDFDENDFLNLEFQYEADKHYPNEFYFYDNSPVGEATLLNSRGRNVPVNVTGSTDGYMMFSNIKLISGRYINIRDSYEKKHACCVSDIFVEQYFDKGVEPIGKTIQFSLKEGGIGEYTIVGVYKYTAMAFGNFPVGTKPEDRCTELFIPVGCAGEYNAEAEQVIRTATFSVVLYNRDVSVEKATADMQDFIDDWYSSSRYFTAEIENDFEGIEDIEKVIGIVTLIIAVIAAISLLVGGVGVMNIMLVSVTERTREIGIRKALGAKNRTIKMQFVTEAIIICLIGGAIGVMLGLLNGEIVGMVVNSFIAKHEDYREIIGRITIKPPVAAILISLGFSMLTGLFFGLYPAGKAAKMKPIDALRYED